MTKLVKEYVSTSGDTYQLREFDLSKIYHPAEVRKVKASNADFYNAINRDKKAKETAEKEAAKPKILSEDERFELRKKEDDARKQAAKEREEIHVQAALQHQQYLDSSPEIASIFCNSLFTYSNELAHWVKRKYSVIPETIDHLPPAIYRVSLSKTN